MTWICFNVFVFLVLSQCCLIVASTATPEGDKTGPKIICHYHLHTWYDTNFRDYFPEVIDESLCTHIVYTDRVRYTDLAANRTMHDGKVLFYSKVPIFRKKGVNVSISFFKFNAFEFARSLNTSAQTAFVESLVDFMDRNNFNGFDFNWGCRSCSIDQSRSVDDENMLEFIRQLSEAFKPRGFLLSNTVTLNPEVIHPTFDVVKLSGYVDWLTVYPKNPPLNRTSILNSLFSYPGNLDEELSANWTVNYLIEKGVPSQKLVLPSSTIGRTYYLASPEENGLNAPSNNGYKSHFYEICNQITNNNWIVVHNPDKIYGSYAYESDQWATYDDVEDIQRRAEFIIQNNLGGGAISNVNYDDFEDKCKCGAHPLLKALAQVLRNTAGPKLKNCT